MENLFDATSRRYDEMQTLLAQCAYDLAMYVYGCSDWHMNPPYDSLEEQVAKIPDLTEWPIPQTSVPQDHAPD